MRWWVLAGVGLMAVAASAAQELPHAFPRTGATKLFENERVIIWHVTWPAGTPQPMHRHRYDMAGVFLRWGPVRFTERDGTSNPVDTTGFDVPRAFFTPRGLTHREEGLGPPDRESISVDLKDVTLPPLPITANVPRAFPRLGARSMVAENPRVTIWDYTWRADRPVSTHVHERDEVAVFIDGGTILSTAQDGREERSTWRPGDARFLPRGRLDMEAAVEGAPRALIIEIR